MSRLFKKPGEKPSTWLTVLTLVLLLLAGITGIDIYGPTGPPIPEDEIRGASATLLQGHYTALITQSGSYYFAVNGTTGNLWHWSTNVTLVEEWTLGNVTAGTVLLKEIQHNTSLAIPAQVFVEVRYNDTFSFYGGYLAGPGMDVDWLDLGGINRTTWPTGAGAGSGEGAPGAYSYWITYNTTGFYAWNGSTGAAEFSGTNGATVVNSAFDECEKNGKGKVFLDWNIDIRGTVEMTESISIEGMGSPHETTNLPHISRIIINATTGSIYGQEIEGISFNELYYDMESNGIHAAGLRDVMCDTNSSMRGIIWEGDANEAGTGESYNWHVENMRLTHDMGGDPWGGYVTGAISFIEMSQGTGRFSIDNSQFSLRGYNNTLFFVDEYSLMGALYLNNPDFYVGYSKWPNRIFYQAPRNAAVNLQGFRVQVYGGRLEAHSSSNLIEIAEQSLNTVVVYNFDGMILSVDPPGTVTLFNTTETSNWQARSSLYFHNMPKANTGTVALGNIPVSDNVFVSIDGNVGFTYRQDVSSYSYLVDGDAAGWYAIDGATGEIEFQGSSSTEVLQDAIYAVEATTEQRGSIHLSSSFYSDGEVQITKSVSLYGSTRHYIDAALYYPHISRVVVNSTGGSIRGIVLQGLSMFTLWHDMGSNGIHAMTVADSHIDMRNATSYGLVFEGDGGLGTGESYNFVFRDSRISYDAPVGDGGYDWGCITLIDVDQGSGHFWFDNPHFTLRTDNSTVLVIREQSIADKMYWDEPEIYIDPSTDNSRIIYVQSRHADQNMQGLRLQVNGGRLEAHQNMTMVEIADDNTMWQVVCVAFRHFDLGPVGSNDRVTIWDANGHTEFMANSHLIFESIPHLGNGILDFGDLTNNGELYIVLSELQGNVTRNTGSGIVAAIPGEANVTGSVEHGLGMTPTYVDVFGGAAQAGKIWTIGFNSTHIDYQIGVAVTSDVDVYFTAIFDPNDYW